ncbi:MAG: transposase [Ardenticatenaceae bacterium]|nr:transposase [Ardenticatenaceae bacterium]
MIRPSRCCPDRTQRIRAPNRRKKYAANTNELEEKNHRPVRQGDGHTEAGTILTEMYGVDELAATISQITEKVYAGRSAVAKTGHSEAIYPIIYLDALHLKLRREGKVANTAVYIVLGGAGTCHRDVLGH